MSDGVRLTWPGKRPVIIPDPLPVLAPHGTGVQSSDNHLFCGDNLAVMAALAPELAGQFALIYFDPPFFTGKEWRSRPNAPTTAAKLDPAASLVPSPDPTPGRNSPGNEPDDGSRGQIQNSEYKIRNTAGFSDVWPGDIGGYLQWLLDRLTVARILLRDDGCIYLHLSWHAVHHAKLVMDEVFGADQFQNEVVWCYREAINSKRRWNRKHDNLLFYSKTERFTFNCDAVREPYSESTIGKFRSRDARGPYRLMGRGISGSPLRSKRDLPAEMETRFPELTYRHYLGEGTLPVDYWLIDIENQASSKRTGYPTQKPEALLERILLASTNEGDLVGDFCCGSGTTLAVAERLKRRWVGCDANPDAAAVARARLVGNGAAFVEFRVHPSGDAE